MNDYYKEIEHLIKRNEVNKQVRKIQDNSEDLNTKWEIGRLLVEAQGGRDELSMEIRLLESGLRTLVSYMAVGIIQLI